MPKGYRILGLIWVNDKRILEFKFNQLLFFIVFINIMIFHKLKPYFQIIHSFDTLPSQAYFE